MAGVSACGNQDTEVQEIILTQQSAESSIPIERESSEDIQNSLAEELVRYRKERDDNIVKENGLIEGSSPEESNYSFDMSGLSYTSNFDSREAIEAYEKARLYVTDTLGIVPSTKLEVYACVDPEILSIYDNEDKGAAKGYENSNIFVCEYCDESKVWQYLILVRDGKGKDWEVIYSGSSYQE